LAFFVILFLVHFWFPSSFLVRCFFVLIWVLVSIVRSFSHFLPAFLLLLFISPKLHSSYFSFFFLLLFLCTVTFCNQFSIEWLPPGRALFIFSVLFCQPVFFFLSFVAFPRSSHLLLCRLPAISILIYPLKSSGGYFSLFGIDSSSARFASSSTSSFSPIQQQDWVH
jgi:hypothetical protein